MHPSLLQIKEFTYPLPDERIARYPLPERDASRLLIAQNGSLTEDIYRNIAAHLPEGTLVVFNQTKVVPARLLFQKPTGGRIEVFCLEPDSRYADMQSGMQQRGSVYWQCMIGGAAKWKEGQVLTLEVPLPQPAGGLNDTLTVTATRVGKKEGLFVLELSWAASHQEMSFAEVLQYAGQVPLPPYLNRAAEEEDLQRYQTIFAKEEGSVAAPTAALHFTGQVLRSLAEKKVQSAFLTLHVGAGTFQPVKSDTMEGHEMHAEWIEVTSSLLEQLIRKAGGASPSSSIVAIGTTSARTLESLYWIGVRLIAGEEVDFSGIAVPQWYPYERPSSITPQAALEALSRYMAARGLSRLITRTRIIIAPGYSFRLLRGLVTNFHQPQSTLLLLVAALVGPSWKALYDHALRHGFRFLSYGDGCLLWGNAPADPV